MRRNKNNSGGMSQFSVISVRNLINAYLSRLCSLPTGLIFGKKSVMKSVMNPDAGISLPKSLPDITDFDRSLVRRKALSIKVLSKSLPILPKFYIYHIYNFSLEGSWQ